MMNIKVDDAMLVTIKRLLKINLTRDITWAVATDAANRRMRKHGRTNWSRGDYNFAVREFDRILPDPEN